MRFSRFSAASIGLLLVPGLLFSACSDDASTPATGDCSDEDCAGADPGTSGKQGQTTGGKSANSGGTNNQAAAGDSAAGHTSTPDPAGGSAGWSEGGAGGQAGAAGQGTIEPPEPKLPQGSACEDSKECETGYCADGVCCDGSCGNGCFSCKGSETGGADGICKAITADTDPHGDCDPDVPSCTSGECDGAGSCQNSEDGTPCRDADGVCDVAEKCAGGLCPSDAVAEPATVCRSKADTCDVAEACDGLSKACPADQVAGYNTVCRAKAGACDVTDYCDGETVTCVDKFSTTFAETCLGGYRCSGTSSACSTSCAINSDCQGGMYCNSEAQCVPGKRIFVTSTVHAANFGAATNADAICQARATDAKLYGTFLAWVSTTTASAATRNTHSTLRYYRMDGLVPRVIATNWDDLINGTTVAVATDETGTIQGNSAVFTGTESNGTLSANGNCQNWSVALNTSNFAAGNSSAAATNVPNWSHYWNYTCDLVARFYCVEQ